MYVEIPRPRDATELSNDGMIKSGDVHYQTEPNFINFSERDLSLTNDDSGFCSLMLSAMTCSVVFFFFWKTFVKCPSLSVNGIFDDVKYDVIST